MYAIYTGAPSCMTTLAINLGIVLASSIVVGNTVGIILPYFNYWLVVI